MAETEKYLQDIANCVVHGRLESKRVENILQEAIESKEETVFWEALGIIDPIYVEAFSMYLDFIRARIS